MATRRFASNTSRQTMTFEMPVSSSSVTNTTPFAVPGRCRISTMPATVRALS